MSAPHVSHADLGGSPGHGAVRPTPESDPPFHAAWQARALALTLAMGATGEWNLDMSRAAREALDDYARLDYYAIWLAALERLLAGRQLVRPEEIAAGRSLHPARPLERVLRASEVAALLARGAPTERASADAPAPRFAVGDAVRTRSARVDHHTRLPGYAHGRRGVIERLHGRHVFADEHARGRGEQPQWLYGVAFDGAELWGAAKTGGLSVSIDAWEPYLEPA